MSKIISLKAENIKRLKAVHIEPDGSPVVIIAGRNGQGKSSVLDTIMYALAGKATHCQKPVRDGQKKGTTTCELDNGLIVTRTITAGGGGSLKVTTGKHGVPHKAPQKLLDDLVGALTFDPLAFNTMEPRKQAETLRGLAGLDFGALDNEREDLYSQRTETNRQIKGLVGEVECGMGAFPGAPAEEIDVYKLTQELEAMNGRNRDQEIVRNEHREALEDIERLQAELKERKGEAKHYEGRLADPENPTSIRNQLEGAQETNRQVQSNQRYNKLASKIKILDAAADDITESLKKIDQAKEDQIKAAKLPVEGLGLGDDGVLYRGVPFEQCSTAERLRVSVAMGLAANPDLKVLLVRDGNALDADNLKLVHKMAEEAKAQVWLEVIDPHGETAFVIEDGEVVG